MDPYGLPVEEPDFSRGEALGEGGRKYRKFRVLDADWRLPPGSPNPSGEGEGKGDGDAKAPEGAPLDFNRYAAVGAALGGPVAFAPAAMLRAGQGPGAPPPGGDAGDDIILIMNCAGALHGTIKWGDKPPLLSMGWSRSESLVCACADGSIFSFTLRGQPLSSTSLFEGAGAGGGNRLADAVVWEGGVVGLSFDESVLWVVEQPDLLANPDPSVAALSRSYHFPTGLAHTSVSGVIRQVTCMAVMQPVQSEVRVVRVVLATRAQGVVVRSKAGFLDQSTQEMNPARITRMAVAPNHRFIACYREDGWLTVLGENFEGPVLDTDINPPHPPLDMVWCGEDSFVMHFRDFLRMFGPSGQSLKYPYRTPLKLVGEIDCLRILTPRGTEILQRVPADVETVRRIGSTASAAMLYDAMERFEAGDPGADESIRGLEDDAELCKAVRCCIDAALGEFKPANQKSLLKAAAYGKNFCASFDPDDLVLATRRLRVLNQVRRRCVGLPLTHEQLARGNDQLTYGDPNPSAWLARRLAARGLHAVALEACDLLELPDAKSEVLLHWACEKVRARSSANMQDEELAELIARRLGIHKVLKPKNNGIAQLGYKTPPAALKLRPSISQVAQSAAAAGRRSLAVKLLEREPLANERVPLLLNLEEYEQAVASAERSWDPDLMLYCLLLAERRMAGAGGSANADGGADGGSGGGANGGANDERRRFHELVLRLPEAGRMLKAVYRQRMDAGVSTRAQDQHALISLCRHEGGAAAEAEAAETLVKEAFAANRVEVKVVKLRAAQRLYDKSRENSFMARTVEESMELLGVQEELERRTGREGGFVNLSVTETIHNLISLAAMAPAAAESKSRSRSGEDSVTHEWCHTEAAAIARKFNVSEKRLWRIRIRAMGASGQWQQLKRLASARYKPPVGYAPFAKAALEGKRPADEVFFYIDKVPDLEQRFELYAAAGAAAVAKAWFRAYEVASSLRDEEERTRRLHAVRTSCGDAGLIAHIDERLAQM